MIMEIFKQGYLNACKEIKVLSDEKVLNQVAGGNGTASLSLQSCRLNKETCSALGYALAKDVYLSHLDLTDCLLPEKSLSEILKGLVSNRTLRSLNLKGNGMKSSSVQILGKFLQNNKGVTKLTMDWNSLGILPDKFFIFCEGLAMNSTLRELSLKNNQLNHQCGSVLANALVKNTSLESLFLQSNNLGLLGGRALLSSLYKNRTLVQLDISSNNMTKEIEKAIDIAVIHNKEQYLSEYKHAEEARVLTGILRSIENNKQEELSVLLNALETCKNSAANKEKQFNDAITSLEQELTERNTAYEILSSKYQKLGSSVALSEERLKELTVDIEKLYAENSHLKQNLIDNKRIQSDVEQQLMNELNAQNEKIEHLETQLDNYQWKEKNLENTLQNLKVTMAKVERKARLQQSEYEDEIQAIKARHSQAFLTHQDIWQNDVERLKMEQSDMEANYEERIQSLLNQRLQLEKTNSELRITLAAERGTYDEKLAQVKIKMKSEEDALRHQLQEQVDLFESAKAKNEKILEEQLHVIKDLETKSIAISQELEERDHKMEKLQQQLIFSDEEKEIAISKVKLELKDRLEEIDKLKEEKQQLFLEIEQAGKKAAESEAFYEQKLKAKDDIINGLNLDKTRYKQIIDEERQLAAQLQKAVSSYLSSKSVVQCS